MAENVVETRNLTKIYRDFWGRKKKTALKRCLNLRGRRCHLRLKESTALSGTGPPCDRWEGFEDWSGFSFLTAPTLRRTL